MMTQQYVTLRRLRTERNMTQMELAVRLGVSITTVANLESGKHQPRMQLAQRIAALFDVPLDNIRWGKVEEA